jgi:flavin reductase
MACVGAAVNIITTDGPAGRAASPPARSAASPIAAHPAGLPEPRRVRLADVQRTPHAVRQYPGAGQEPLSNLFGGKTPMESACRRRWQTGDTGCPRLEDALASFDCRISQVVSVGTHDILFCDIVSIIRHPRRGADVV